MAAFRFYLRFTPSCRDSEERLIEPIGVLALADFPMSLRMKQWQAATVAA
jgi:hypothetical protein